MSPCLIRYTMYYVIIIFSGENTEVLVDACATGRVDSDKYRTKNTEAFESGSVTSWIKG